MDWRNELDHMRSLHKMAIHFDEHKCVGDWACYQVCPVGCWTPDHERRKAVFHNDANKQCVACGACVLQCPQDAIELK